MKQQRNCTSCWGELCGNQDVTATATSTFDGWLVDEKQMHVDKTMMKIGVVTMTTTVQVALAEIACCQKCMLVKDHLVGSSQVATVTSYPMQPECGLSLANQWM